MSGLTTHVLDLAHGRPAAGVTIELFAQHDAAIRLARVTTDSDGRVSAPLIRGDRIQTGLYRLDFHVGDYFRGLGLRLADPPFLDIVGIAFGISDADASYHVPLLISPYGYSTYRGS